MARTRGQAASGAAKKGGGSQNAAPKSTLPASKSKATGASKTEKKASKAQSDSELSDVEDEISVEVVNQSASTDHDDVDSDNPSEAGQTSEEEWTSTKSKQSTGKRKSGNTKAKTGKSKRKSQPQSDSESEDKPAKRVKGCKTKRESDSESDDQPAKPVKATGKNAKKGKEVAVEEPEASEGDEEVEAQGEEDSDYQAQDLLPIKKKKGKTPFKRRKKKKVKHVKGKRGMLKAVLDLPIECFSLIADHLEHKDLYNLAQVNKFFKDMLSAASADHIWQDAADRDGIPELAVPMSNMQLAHLLYSKECFECGHFPVHKRLFEQRIVLCKACQKTEQLTANKLRKEDLKHPLAFVSINPPQFYMWKVLKRHAHQIDQILLRELPNPPENASWDPARLDYRYPDAPALDIDPETFTVVRPFGPLTKVGHIVSTIQKRRQGLREDGAALRTWYNRKKDSRHFDLSDLRYQRQEEIKRRMISEHGWTNNDFVDTGWWYSPPQGVKAAAPLTERSFLNMLPRLEEWRTQMRAERALRAKRADEQRIRASLKSLIYEDYAATHDGTAFALPFNLFCKLPLIRELWEDKMELDESALASNRQAILEQARNVTTECKIALAQRIIESYENALEAKPDFEFEELPKYDWPPSLEQAEALLRLPSLECTFKSVMSVNSWFMRQRNVEPIMQHEQMLFSAAIRESRITSLFAMSSQFVQLEESFKDAAENILDLVLDIIIIQPRHLIARDLAMKAFKKANPEADIERPPADARWRCEQCALSMLLIGRVTTHLQDSHLYRDKPWKERCFQGEDDDLEAIASTDLPTLVYFPRPAPPPAPTVMTSASSAAETANEAPAQQNDDDHNVITEGPVLRDETSLEDAMQDSDSDVGLMLLYGA